MAYNYGIPDGTYVGKPTTASCYEKDGKLILDIKFAVKDPQTGAWYKKENGYDWEVNKRHWLTALDGSFHLATLNGIKEGLEPAELCRLLLVPAARRAGRALRQPACGWRGGA